MKTNKAEDFNLLNVNLLHSGLYKTNIIYFAFPSQNPISQMTYMSIINVFNNIFSAITDTLHSLCCTSSTDRKTIFMYVLTYMLPSKKPMSCLVGYIGIS